MKEITELTKNDIEWLRKCPVGTNGRSVHLTRNEVYEMRAHLETLYRGKVQPAFAERVALRNKEN